MKVLLNDELIVDVDFAGLEALRTAVPVTRNYVSGKGHEYTVNVDKTVTIKVLADSDVLGYTESDEVAEMRRRMQDAERRASTLWSENYDLKKKLANEPPPVVGVDKL